MAVHRANQSFDSDQKRSASNRQLPSLTSLRGLAALWVVLYHYCVQCFPNLDAAQYTSFIGKGYLAVDMFFMLSGFVMTHVYQRAFYDPNGIKLHYRSFLIARFARLYPLHIFVLFLFVVTVLVSQLVTFPVTGSFQGIPLEGPDSVTAFVANIFMLQGLAAGKLSWNYPAWSISVEFMAYLAFPFALPIIWRASNMGKIILAFFALAALAWLAFLKSSNFDQWDGPITLLRCLPEFLLGSLLYFGFRTSPRNCWLNQDALAFGIVVATVLCLHLDAPDLLIVALFAVLIPIAVVNTGVFAKFANVGPLIWLGEVSYSLYLVHGLVQFVSQKLMDALGIQTASSLSIGSSLALMLVMVGVCFLASTATYSGVEIAWRRCLRERLGSHQNRPAGILNSQRG